MSTSASERSLTSDGTGTEQTEQTGQAGPQTTPEMARLVRLSCRRLADVESEFAMTLRHTLNEAVPGMRQLSPASGASVSAALTHCVLWAVLTQDPPEAVAAALQRLGADNYRQGFPDDAYPDVDRAWLRSARDILSPDWDSRLSSAWVSYCRWLDSHLRFGATLARATDARLATLQASLA